MADRSGAGQAVTWTLVTDDLNGGSRSALAAVRALAREGYQVAVTTSSPSSLAAASRDCDRRIPVPRAGSPTYAAAVHRAAQELGGAVLLPSSDVALVALQPASGPLTDKQLLAGLVARSGLLVVPGRRFADGRSLLQAAGGLDYPVIVKPAVKVVTGSSAVRAETAADLERLARERSPLLAQPFLSGPLRAVSGVLWKGELRAVVHQAYRRIWPTDAGVASSAVTVGPDLETERRITQLLAGHDGVFQVQLIGDHVLDVNPRIYGSLPLAVAAGANLPALACRAAAGQDGDLVRARAGVRYRWAEGDLRSLVDLVRRRRMTVPGALMELLPRRGTAHSVESWRDPAPAVVRVRQALGRSA